MPKQRSAWRQALAQRPGGRLDVELAPEPGARHRGPGEEPVQGLDLVLLIEIADAEIVKAAEAEVVLAADAERVPEIAEHALEEGKVLVHELLLERLGIGGNDSAAVLFARPDDQGNEIGQAFADARARLDDQMRLVAERFLDSRGHLNLLGPVLVGHAHGLRDHSRFAEDLERIHQADRLTQPRGRCKFYLYCLFF